MLKVRLNLRKMATIVASLAVGLTMFVSCEKSDDNDISTEEQHVVEPQLSVSPEIPISFTKDGGASEAKTITVTTNQSSWDAQSSQTWCTVVKKETNQFTVTAAANTDASGRTASITVTAGKAPEVTLSITQASGPNIAFIARNPVTESLYSPLGFFQGCRINFNLVVYDAAGMTSITISEEATGAPNGNRKTFSQTRVIPISGAGTYPLLQEISRNRSYGDIYGQFVYTVSAHGKSYTRYYSGDYSAYDGSWGHYFVIK
jgi:hypothetical protein